MVQALRRLPLSVIIAAVAWVGLSAMPGCAGCTFKISCGGVEDFADNDNSGAGLVNTAKLSGGTRVTKSTHPDVQVGMRCRVDLEKLAGKTVGHGRVNCFAGDDVNAGVYVYDGHAVIEGEERGEGPGDNRFLWIDESSDVRARIEYDGTRETALTVRIWSVKDSWEVAAQATKEGA